jgi:hypothetical protein
MLIRTTTPQEVAMTATLKVSRATGFGIELRRGSFDVQVDGKTVGSLDHGHSTEVMVESGRHTLQIRRGRYCSPERAFEAAEGQTVSFQCHGDKTWPMWLVSFVKPSLAIALQES